MFLWTFNNILLLESRASCGAVKQKADVERFKFIVTTNLQELLSYAFGILISCYAAFISRP